MEFTTIRPHVEHVLGEIAKKYSLSSNFGDSICDAVTQCAVDNDMEIKDITEGWVLQELLERLL